MAAVAVMAAAVVMAAAGTAVVDFMAVADFTVVVVSMVEGLEACVAVLAACRVAV
jgi:hypothetical protein